MGENRLVDSGRQMELERILKLLDSNCKCKPDASLCWAAKAIALIKGEK